MFSGLLPKEAKFFDLFVELADLLVEGAKEMARLANDASTREDCAKKLFELEMLADRVTQRIIALLRTTFITPLDREDMYHLVSEMDSVLDSLEAAGQRVFLYNVSKLPPEAKDLANISVEATQHLREAIRDLSNLKDTDGIVKCCVAVNSLENRADQALRSGLSRLFKEENDTRELIKLKEILEILEEATDRCEDVADIVDRIVLEHA